MIVYPGKELLDEIGLAYGGGISSIVVYYLVAGSKDVDRIGYDLVACSQASSTKLQCKRPSGPLTAMNIVA